MKSLRLIIALLLLGTVIGSNAQVTRRTGNDPRKKDKNSGPVITDRRSGSPAMPTCSG